jgi:hypothetical protein
MLGRSHLERPRPSGASREVSRRTGPVAARTAAGVAIAVEVPIEARDALTYDIRAISTRRNV